MKYGAIILLFVASLQLAPAKIFERCELVDELLSQGFLKNLLPDWICLIERHSGRDTSKVMKLDDGTTQWGLYQINDNYWCKSGVIGGFCDLTCESLLTDNITDASICATQIYNSGGFESWQGWNEYCTGWNDHYLPDLTPCFLNSTIWSENP